MRVLVTGAGGFLGGAISRRLAERDDLQVIAAARTDLPNMAAALSRSRPDVVVHAAGRTHGAADALGADNVALTKSLAAAIADAAPQCGLILLGSAAQYGPSQDRTLWRESGPCAPIDDYGTSKLVAEAAAFAEAARSRLRVTSLRIFNVIAPEPHGQQAYPSFLRKLAAAMASAPPRRIAMGDLSAIRDFVALDDVLLAVEQVIDSDVWGEPINVCTGVGRSVREVLEDVSRAAADATPGIVEISESGPRPALDWSVGDPATCQARLGFSPSSDLSELMAASAAWVRRTATEWPDA